MSKSVLHIALFLLLVTIIIKIIIIIFKTITMLRYNADKRNIQKITIIVQTENYKTTAAKQDCKVLSNTKVWHTGLLYNQTQQLQTELSATVVLFFFFKALTKTRDTKIYENENMNLYQSILQN